MNYEELTRDMRKAKEYLSSLPVDREFTAEELDELESLRHEAIGLKMEVEAIFESVTGDPERDN